jgi:pimeloyl-ACP methyl ester carboxylesterase
VAGFDGDPRQYTTPAFIADLEAVRGALGVDRFNLWGGSYGSRVALAYLAAHPDRIRVAIVDGVAPTSMRIIQEAFVNGEAQLAKTLADCAATPACAAAYPKLEEDWQKLQRDFAQPVPVTFPHPRNGVAQTVDVDFLALDGALRTLLYSAEYSAMVPELVTRTAAGDVAPLFAASLRIAGDMGQGMNVGLQLSVVCAEDAGRAADASAAPPAAGVRDATAATGTPAPPLAAVVFERLAAACAEWPHGSVPVAFHAPTTASNPVLLLSGGLDPVTPAANGELVARTLGQALHVVAPGYGHLVSPYGCAPRLIARFVDDGNTKALPEDCLKSLRSSKRPPFFVNRLEAKP